MLSGGKIERNSGEKVSYLMLMLHTTVRGQRRPYPRVRGGDIDGSRTWTTVLSIKEEKKELFCCYMEELQL